MASSSAPAAISLLHFSSGPPRRRAVGYRGPIQLGRFRADCVVVGAGISGLCTAQALIVRPGRGNITTVERDGYLWEEGPNSFQPSDAVLTMAVLWLPASSSVSIFSYAPRFVLWQGKLRPVPAKPTDLPFFDLMSIGGKLRAGFGAIGLRPLHQFSREESVEEFVRRNLGDEVFERLIEPFCSGVYAGDPSKLSMKAAFGKVWKLEQTVVASLGALSKQFRRDQRTPSLLEIRNEISLRVRLPTPKGQTVGSFSKGLAMLPNAIASRLGDRVKLSWKLASIEKSEGKGYVLTYDTPEGVVSVAADCVVLTVPSYIASNLLRPLSNDAAEALAKFYYPPVAAVTISYPSESIRSESLIDGQLKGFGQLHPRSQGVETLGMIHRITFFPLTYLLSISQPGSPGRVLLLNYIGGATNAGIVSKSESDLVESVDRDLRKMLIKVNAVEPLFLVGHLDRLDAAKSALSRGGLDGLILGGNYVAGVALGRCVEGAYETAAQVSSFLSRYAYTSS
ncbi:unnamed protein product [Spirodela intermedia]|uniref:Protoporphyrinogen oxidase n=1 Tax=Spirodela intermedia TaxID=51605 RepID=A0A7I8IW56_SPIIN|nr:unnamed protein product [Spirodela intermedia]CAA6662227.1 unnamed protein product [Spirodela intermedia]